MSTEYQSVCTVLDKKLDWATSTDQKEEKLTEHLGNF